MINNWWMHVGIAERLLLVVIESTIQDEMLPMGKVPASRVTGSCSWCASLSLRSPVSEQNLWIIDYRPRFGRALTVWTCRDLLAKTH